MRRQRHTVHSSAFAVAAATLAFVSRHSYPLNVSTRVSGLHPHGNVFEGRAYWRFGNREFSAVAYATTSHVAAVIAESKLVALLNTMRGLDVLGTRRAA